jgi:predicted nucleotidyltransferase
MDVAMPISTVIPTLDGQVLATLAATTAPITLSEIHRRVDRGSKSGIRNVLLRMLQVGVVHEVLGGFVLNRDHLAANSVVALADLHGELARRIRFAVQSSGIETSLVGLFGSAARRDGDIASDIDVLIISESNDLDEFRNHLAKQLFLWTGNHAQVQIISNSELRRLRKANEPIVANWDRDIVVISGDERALKGCRS